LLSGESRDAFRAALPVDATTWARGRGWALWKALITFAGNPDANAGETEAARQVINDVLAKHKQLS
jgi:aminoglycoside phosphotransferase (APT) family kinase protein